MLCEIEGSKAVAAAVAACRPGVVCAYPISPQTHIVEELSRLGQVGQAPLQVGRLQVRRQIGRASCRERV